MVPKPPLEKYQPYRERVVLRCRNGPAALAHAFRRTSKFSTSWVGLAPFTPQRCRNVQRRDCEQTTRAYCLGTGRFRQPHHSCEGPICRWTFEFVAAGQTLPAGEYKITPLRDDKPRVLLLTNLDNRNKSVLLVPIADETSQDKPQLGFTTVGDQRVLSRVQTDVCAYTLALPRAEAEALLAAAPKQLIRYRSALAGRRPGSAAQPAPAWTLRSLAGCVARVDSGGPRKGRSEKGDIG